MCPECGEPLVAFELEGIEIDRCVTCGGTWLDAGELATITELSGAAPGRMREALAAAKGRKAEKRRCPRCRAKLRVITIGEEEPIELDRCPRGHGLWLDRGEIRAVIKSFGEGEEGAVARFFSDLLQNDLKEST